MALPPTNANPFDDIGRDLVAPVESVGDEIVEQVKGTLTVLCTQFHDLGGAGGERRHSVRGEHPRQETGALLDSIARDVKYYDHVVTLTVGSDVLYAPILEFKLDRPIFRDVLEQYETRLMDAALRAIAGEQ